MVTPMWIRAIAPNVPFVMDRTFLAPRPNARS